MRLNFLSYSKTIVSLSQTVFQRRDRLFSLIGSVLRRAAANFDPKLSHKSSR